MEKHLAAKAGDTGSIPGVGDSIGMEQLSLCTTAAELRLYSLKAANAESTAASTETQPRAHALQQETPLQEQPIATAREEPPALCSQREPR